MITAVEGWVHGVVPEARPPSSRTACAVLFAGVRAVHARREPAPDVPRLPLDSAARHPRPDHRHARRVPGIGAPHDERRHAAARTASTASSCSSASVATCAPPSTATPTVIDTGAFEATIDYADAQRVVAIASTPAIAGLDQLVGRSASTGFRAALNEVVAGQDVVGRPVYQLLDDLPVATLISGFSPQQAMAARGHLGATQRRAHDAAAHAGRARAASSRPICARDGRPAARSSRARRRAYRRS